VPTFPVGAKIRLKNSPLVTLSLPWAHEESDRTKAIDLCTTYYLHTSFFIDFIVISTQAKTKGNWRGPIRQNFFSKLQLSKGPIRQNFFSKLLPELSLVAQ
jgi:hypothetical protein